MDNLLLSPRTRKSLGEIIKGETHAILLTGPTGAGKSYLARIVAAMMMGRDVHKIDASSFIVNPEGKSIGIEVIRQVQRFLQLKTAGTHSLRRAVIIEDSELMTLEAQNAILKILEEPPIDTIIVLTSSQPALLRSTVLSRTQQVLLTTATKQDSLSYFTAKGYKAVDIEKAYLLADGQPGLMNALLTGDDHPLVERIEESKKLFGMSAYERMLAIDAYTKSRDELQGLLYACKRIATSALEGSVHKDSKLTEAWLKRLKHIVQAEASMTTNPNSKLLLTDLFLNL
jgi:replication-associated recombination protein RarA